MRYRISLTLPPEYGQLEILKANSYPYKTGFDYLIRTIMTIYQNSELDFYDILGANEKKAWEMSLSHAKGKVSFYYETVDVDTIDFLNEIAAKLHQTKKQIIVRLIQFSLRLFNDGAPSFETMSYKIRKQLNLTDLKITFPNNEPKTQGVKISEDAIDEIAKMRAKNKKQTIATPEKEEKRNVVESPISEPEKENKQASEPSELEKRTQRNLEQAQARMKRYEQQKAELEKQTGRVDKLLMQKGNNDVDQTNKQDATKNEKSDNKKIKTSQALSDFF